MKGKIERYYNFLEKISNSKTIEELIQLWSNIPLENFPCGEEKRLRNKIASKVFNKDYDLHIVLGMTNHEEKYQEVERDCFSIAVIKDLSNYLDEEKQKYETN